jgi:hypothetical protein
VENPHAPRPDPHLRVSFFDRTPMQVGACAQAPASCRPVLAINRAVATRGIDGLYVPSY